MVAIYDAYLWIDRVLFYGEIVLMVWAIADCASRKAAAFPAVDKLTKPAWLAIVLLGTGLSVLAAEPWFGDPKPWNLVCLISVVAAGVYLADVRPAVREVSGGSRW